ncbi:MAG: small basic protein [Planctomycetaceae bacterium]
MSVDKSLKRKGRLNRSRNVLKRDERIEKLQADEKWSDGQSPYGIPKVRVIQVVAGKKKKKKEEEPAADDKKKKK